MGEINTRGAIRSKISEFPSGSDSECLTKTQIISTGAAIVNGSYGDNECPVIDNVLPNVISWNYYFSVSPTSLTFVSTSESKPVSITSYRRKAVNGIETGDQEIVYWSHATEGSGYTTNGGGDMVTFYNNTTTSIRTGRITYTQQLSGITAILEVSQAAGTVSFNYIFNVSPDQIECVGDSINTRNGMVRSEYIKYINGSYNSKVNDVDWGFSEKLRDTPRDVLSLDVYDMSTHTTLLATFVFTKTSQTAFTIHCERHDYDYSSFTDDVEIYIKQKNSNNYYSLPITISD